MTLRFGCCEEYPFVSEGFDVGGVNPIEIHRVFTFSNMIFTSDDIDNVDLRRIARFALCFHHQPVLCIKAYFYNGWTYPQFTNSKHQLVEEMQLLALTTSMLHDRL